MNMTTPLVSVIIPTYNRADLILRAVRSVQAQTYPNWEVIVVDDASADNTPAVLSAVHDPRVRVLRHEKNQGPPATRNTGIAAARGEYLAFLDSDDEWLPQKLKTQIAAMQQHQAHFCYCQTYVKSPGGTQQAIPAAAYNGGSLLKYLICDGGCMQSSILVIHKDYVVPFDPGIVCHDDWDWVSRILEKKAKFLFVAQPLSHFHTDAKSRSTTSGKDGDALFSEARGKLLWERAQPFLKRHEAEISENPGVMRHLGCWYSQDAFLRGNRKLALNILWKHRIFPSFFSKPKAFKLWANCLNPIQQRRTRTP